MERADAGGWAELEARVVALRDAGDLGGAATLAIEGSRAAIERYLLSQLHDPDDARDAVSLYGQETWQGLPGFRGGGTLKAWLFSVATHAAARLRRDPYRRRAEPLPSGSAALGFAPTVSRLFPSGRQAALEALQAELDPASLRLLDLRIQWEVEWESAAELLSAEGTPVTAAALRKRYERLRRRLERRAQELGLLG